MPEQHNIQQVEMLMDSVLNTEKEKGGEVLVIDSVSEMGDKLHSLNKDMSVNTIHQTILDSIHHYEKEHGTKPSSSLIAIALDHANILLDDATSGTSQASAVPAFLPMQPMLAIRAIVSGAIPFAHHIQADKVTGQASLIIVEHQTGSKTGRYSEGSSLNGINSGDNYLLAERTHKLSSSDNTTFTGKITPIQTSHNECDQSVTAHPLYSKTTQIYICGLLVATSSGRTEEEGFTGVYTFAGEKVPFSGTVNTTTGEVSVKFAKAVPANTLVEARGFLNFEAKQNKSVAPSVITQATRYEFTAKSYRSQVVVTPEAKAQFAKEIGIDPAFEGTMAIRNQFSLEVLYRSLRRLSVLGQFTQQATFDFDWDRQGLRKNVDQILLNLLYLINKESQTMANRNGSHGVSHIYVGDTMRSLLLSLGSDFFEPSGLVARPGPYRLGRLGGMYEVYYTPKGILTTEEQAPKSERLLLIGANPANPAFNPLILGEAVAPTIEQVGATTQTPDTGYWVTGKNFVEQNPVDIFAQSVAVVDVTNAIY